MRKAQTIIEYSFLIILAVGTFLYMQNYLKRSMQGNLEDAAGKIGEQYALGLTSEETHSNQTTRRTTLNTPGWGHPWTIVWSSGASTFNSTQKLPALNKSWQPQ
jgi:hypothetical protein